MHIKKYQYLYLKQKLETKMSDIKYECELYDCYDDEHIEKDWMRINFYTNWLEKINSKKNYV